MKTIYQWVKDSNPYNSLHIYAKYLNEAFSKIYKCNTKIIHPRISSYEKIISKITQSDCEDIVFWHYGVYDSNMKYIIDSSKVLFVFHNITPAKYFWLTDPLSSLRAIGTYLHLILLSKEIKWITPTTFNKTILNSFGFKNIDVCPFIPINRELFDYSNISKNNKVSLLFVGRIIENKNCIALIQQITILASLLTNKQIELVIVGKIPQNTLYGYKFKKLLAAKNKIENLHIINIENVGDEELYSCYKNSYLYVTMSLHEGLGIPVCESIYNGTPALYLECGGQESVLNSIGMIPLSHRNSFHKYIYDLIIDKDKRDVLLQSQLKIVKELTVPNIYDSIKNTYGKYLQ